MSDAEPAIRLKAPEKNGQILSVPPWRRVGDLLSANRACRKRHRVDIQGRSLSLLAKEARQAVLAEALAYTRSYADVDDVTPADAPLVLTGHQPEFVHPGVWLKEFAAAHLASQSDGTVVSLIIDSDLCRAPSIRVPTGTVQQPRVEIVAYDRTVEQMPLEERTIVDPSIWESFGARATEAIAPLVPSPLIAQWWPPATETSHLGLAIAQARHRLEIDWGIRNLNIPQSRLCQTAPFRQFAAHLLANAPRFREAHNRALADYRRVHRLRNHAQPMPDLVAIDGLIETPFWIWTRNAPRRQRLFVQPRGRELLLTDRAEFQAMLPLTLDSEATAAVEKLAQWETQGIKIRPRALITTMFARLLLADLFIHGIGGAKYDQATDAIIEDFFGFSAAPYVTLSGTLRLPIACPPISPTRIQELHQELRELTYHPESQIARLNLNRDEQAEVASIVAQKLTWVKTPKTSANALQRHRQIAAANGALQPWVEPHRRELLQELTDAKRQLQAKRLLESREYPFCLFPRDQLRKFLLDFSSRMT